MDYNLNIYSDNFFNDQDVYSLEVIDGICWGFRAVDSIKKWLDIFADIMNLKKVNCNKINRYLTFIEKGSEVINRLNLNQWDKFKQGSAFCIWTSNVYNDIIFELNTKFLEHPEIKIIFMWSALKRILLYYTINNFGSIHSAAASFDGKGILIAAPGGMGKSTSIRRLPDYWQPLCDDLVLIIESKNNEFFIQPMPTWSDHLESTRYSRFETSKAIPLKAIFFLSQSKRDYITSLHRSEATQFIYDSSMQCWENYLHRIDNDSKKHISKKIFSNSYNLSGVIPCYVLETTLYGSFWLEIEKVL